MDQTTRINLLYADIVIATKCAFVPTAYFGGVSEVLRDRHYKPNGGKFVFDEYRPIGQYIYLD